MATLSIGKSTTVTLYRGNSVSITGYGSYVNSSSLDKSPITISGSTSIGPFNYDCNLSITALSEILYSVSGGDSAKSISYASGVPFIVPSSGSVNNTAGNITVSTGLDYVVGPAYTFFPLGALYASSPSGFYYTNWTAATILTVYADMYSAGVPVIPDSPTPLTTVAGAYTQTTGVDIFGPSYSIAGNYLGINGFIEWNRVVNNNNNANTKIYNMYFGGVLFQGYSQTTNPKAAGQGTIKNRGRSNAQIAASAAYGDNGNASSLPKLTINTATNQVIAFAFNIANAADYAIIESHFVRANKVD